MADDASRLLHLTDHDFLAYFNQVYPQPQPWRLYNLDPTIISSAISALRHKKSPRESFLRAPAKPLLTGTRGPPFVPKYTSILPYKGSKIPSPTSKSLPGASDTAFSTPPNDKFAAVQWRMPYATLAKRSPQWGPRTHAIPKQAKLTSAFNVCLPPTANLTPHRVE